MSDFFTYIIGPIVAAVVSWFVGRKSQAQEVLKLQKEVEQMAQSAKSTELENVEGAIKIWREMAESLKVEMEGMRAKMIDITNQNNELLDRLTALEKEYNQLNRSYNTLKKQLK